LAFFEKVPFCEIIYERGTGMAEGHGVWGHILPENV
jgi:hypothetical protein